MADAEPITPELETSPAEAPQAPERLEKATVSNGPPKPADPACTLSFDFPTFAYTYPVEGDLLAQVQRRKIAPGTIVWLSDGEIRVKATLRETEAVPARDDGDGGMFPAKPAGLAFGVHWGTQQNVVVGQSA